MHKTTEIQHVKHKGNWHGIFHYHAGEPKCPKAHN